MQISTDPATLRAALIGYQQQLEFVNSQIDQLRRKLGKTPASPVFGEAAQARKHHVSPEGRARIAAAQRRRWAAAERLLAPAGKIFKIRDSLGGARLAPARTNLFLPFRNRREFETVPASQPVPMLS